MTHQSAELGVGDATHGRPEGWWGRGTSRWGILHEGRARYLALGIALCPLVSNCQKSNLVSGAWASLGLNGGRWPSHKSALPAWAGANSAAK